MFTERKHLRLYKETRILIQRNHALTQRNACAYNKIFLHLNPIVNRLAQRNACTCTKKNTPLYKEVPCTYTKKYHALIQRSTCTDAKSWDVYIGKHANTSAPNGRCLLINYFRLFPSFPVHLSFACRHPANLILLT